MNHDECGLGEPPYWCEECAKRQQQLAWEALPEKVGIWKRLCAVYPWLVGLEDRLCWDARPPAMDDDEFRRLIGTLCTDKIEALMAVLVPHIVKVISVVNENKKGPV
jgi:hypothetical protein